MTNDIFDIKMNIYIYTKVEKLNILLLKKERNIHSLENFPYLKLTILYRFYTQKNGWKIKFMYLKCFLIKNMLFLSQKVILKHNQFFFIKI